MKIIKRHLLIFIMCCIEKGTKICQIVELIEETNATLSGRGYIPLSKRKKIAQQIS